MDFVVVDSSFLCNNEIQAPNAHCCQILVLRFDRVIFLQLWAHLWQHDRIFLVHALLVVFVLCWIFSGSAYQIMLPLLYAPAFLNHKSSNRHPSGKNFSFQCASTLQLAAYSLPHD